MVSEDNHAKQVGFPLNRVVHMAKIGEDHRGVSRIFFGFQRRPRADCWRRRDTKVRLQGGVCESQVRHRLRKRPIPDRGLRARPSPLGLRRGGLGAQTKNEEHGSERHRMRLL